MKLKITSLLLLAIFLTSTATVGVTNAIAESRVVPVKKMESIERFGNHRRQQTINDRYGQRTGEGIPCPCIFDKMRDMQPKGGLFAAFDYVWGCKVFDQNGLCREVERISKDVKTE